MTDTKRVPREQHSTMRAFVMYRRALLAAGKHDDNQRAPDDAVQFEGVQFHDGTVAIRWRTPKRSTSTWACMDDLLAIHGHPEYGSELVWLDAAPDAPAAPTPTRECRIDEASEACVDWNQQAALDMTQDIAHWLHKWPGGAPNEAWSAVSKLITDIRAGLAAAREPSPAQEMTEWVAAHDAEMNALDETIKDAAEKHLGQRPNNVSAPERRAYRYGLAAARERSTDGAATVVAVELGAVAPAGTGTVAGPPPSTPSPALDPRYCWHAWQYGSHSVGCVVNCGLPKAQAQARAEPTRHPCGHLIVSDECVVCAAPPADDDAALVARLHDASRDDRMATGHLYRKAAEAIARLRADNERLSRELADERTDRIHQQDRAHKNLCHATNNAMRAERAESALAAARAENERMRVAIRCISIRGPDGDGLVWIVCTMPNGDAGAISVAQDRIAAQAFAAWRAAAQIALALGDKT